MFFLPLPFNKNLETIQEVGCSNVQLPDPELYILINGTPTKDKVIWRTLVDVNSIKLAVQKLKEINWLYKDVNNASIDEAPKKVIEVASDTTSTMLEKASDKDIAGFQAYTIRNLDNRLSTKPDIEQYKLLSVKENALDNRQQHLDVMCFSVLVDLVSFTPVRLNSPAVSMLNHHC